MGDTIHNPDHYCFSEYEPRKVIHSWGLNFNLGNAVKYVVRAGRKDDIVQDLKKAQEYIGFEIEEIEAARAKESQKPIEGIRLSEIICMTAKEFRDKYMIESTQDAFEFTYVDDTGKTWILDEISGYTLKFIMIEGGRVAKTLRITLLEVDKS